MHLKKSRLNKPDPLFVVNVNVRGKYLRILTDDDSLNKFIDVDFCVDV